MKKLTEQKLLQMLTPYMEKHNASESIKPFKTEKCLGMALSKYFVAQALEVKAPDVVYERLLSISLICALLRDGFSLGFDNIVPALIQAKALDDKALAEFAKLLTDARGKITRATKGVKRPTKKTASKAAPEPTPAAKVASRRK